MELDDNMLNIDLNALEVEAARQPRLLFQASKELAKQKTEFGNAEKKLEYTHAILIKNVRADPEKYKLDKKPTETAIKSVVLTLKKYRIALNALGEVQYNIDILKGLVNALEHKKRMIEMEITLHGQNYYSTPYVKSDKWKELIDDHKEVEFRKKAVRKKRKRVKR